MEQMLHKESVRDDVVDVVSNLAVGDPGGKCERLVDGVNLDANKHRNKRLQSERDAQDLDAVQRGTQIKNVRIHERGK